MKRSKLTASWDNWRATRRRDLVSGGVHEPAAGQIAAAEAHHRQRIATAIGAKPAQEARLACLGEGASYRFAIVGELAGLTSDQLSRLKALNAKLAATA